MTCICRFSKKCVILNFEALESVKSNSITGLQQTLRFPGVSGSHISRQSGHEDGKVVGHTHRPTLPARKYSCYSFPLDAESTPEPECAGRIMSMKNSNGNIGNRTRDLPACSTLPHPTASPRATGICTCYIFIRTNTRITLPETFSYPIFIDNNSS
jgi:hypothetical protein